MQEKARKKAKKGGFVQKCLHKIAIISERFRNFANETELKTITIMKRKLCPPKTDSLSSRAREYVHAADGSLFRQGHRIVQQSAG